MDKSGETGHEGTGFQPSKKLRQVSDSLLVGNDDCKFHSVLTAIEETPDFFKLVDLWPAIANGIGTPPYKQFDIKEDVLKITNSTNLGEAMYVLIIDWRSRVATEAKLVKLIKVFEENGLTSIANSLVDTFGTYSDDIA